ncbi:1,4-dihydroxy-2-naphthoate polyprenyltransferase [Sporolactobacillus shoreicorticis]|uniref:1,4-dihydroxy-2-naphthoate polyprenyltransferase n=1 Tax=Sporolactobacillus shoreicorticis TaxID=1923877 RepID=A0ABW5S317_9BACL|nr:1,4-dihydroxy-2-naphthoate polyprenyltransferase [Sporolactobacillus shoreicorticis]MCO7125868.1 1,4-dihydroxy-2-naphthoate polyprenyltransferase [Sporolactobacillus shoreicorticis]
MSLGVFLKLVEIQTKLASLFPFIVGCLFVSYRFHVLDPINTTIFFASMLFFDMTATAINNYMDYRKAASEEYRRRENIIGQEHISEALVGLTIILLLAIATALGLLLVARTDLIVLLVGMACFGIGILYSFGPIPLSRMPIGEIFSGITEGLGVLFLTVYVNATDQGIVNLVWEGRTITVQADLLLLFEIVIVSLPCMFTIANIMLANNICDLDDDIKNHRYTLPYYIGKRYAIWLFNGLYAATFAAIIACVLFKILPVIMLFALLAIIPVYKQVKQFNRMQVKSKTFVVAVKNLVFVNGTMAFLLFVAVVL